MNVGVLRNSDLKVAIIVTSPPCGALRPVGIETLFGWKMSTSSPEDTDVHPRRRRSACVASSHGGKEKERKSEVEGKVNGTHSKALVQEVTEERLLVHVISLIAGMVLITYATMPESLTVQTPTVWHVWFYGWLAAITTGLGALPLLFLSRPSDWWLGACNAIAGGMMLSASYSLVTEGVAIEKTPENSYGLEVTHTARVAFGVVLGILFVRCTKLFVEGYEDLRFGDISGLDAAKIFLIISVMTLHSFAEGLGIGVSFCGNEGTKLGTFISMTLAVHNVPVKKIWKMLARS